MFFLARPSPHTIATFLERQAGASLSYAPVGLSNLTPPDFHIDSQRVKIGTGAGAFQAARDAVAAWAMFRLSWVEIHPPAPPIEVGTNVAVLAHHFGFWSLNACRVVSRPSDDPTRRFGFAYGTLHDHAENGEELFVVELDGRDQSVWYELRAVSRPQSLLARLGHPAARQLQARFRRDSALAMRSAVEEAEANPNGHKISADHVSSRASRSE